MYVGKTALVISLTAANARDQLLPLFRKLLNDTDPKTGLSKGFTENRDFKVSLSPITITFSNGSKILFRTLEGSDFVQGLNVSIVYLDEIHETTSEAFDFAYDRCGREGPYYKNGKVGDELDGTMLIATCNPCSRSHWVYTRWFKYKEESGANPEGTCIDTWTIYDNPYAANKIKDAEIQFSYSEAQKRRQLLGQWVDNQGFGV